MRLLYVCGTYAPGAFAGSELSVHQLLRALVHDYAVEALVATDSRYTGGRPGVTTYEGVPIRGIDHADRWQAIAHLISEYNPDAILTQLLWADVALSLAKDKDVPTILRLISIPTNLDLTIPDAIITNADFSSRWVKEKSGRKAHCIASYVDFQRVLVPKSEHAPRLITMFNPIKSKGGVIFLEIAQAMQSRQFAVVPGWHSLRSRDGSWDRSVLRRSLESQGLNFDWTPEDVDFSGTSNVMVLEARDEVREIFAQTRILLVPSQWDETFARVCIESYANGIPVVGSAVAGLQEHLRIAGFPIEEKANVMAWVSAIEALDDAKTYNMYSQRGLNYVHEVYNHEKICEDFIAVMKSICHAVI